MTIRPHCVSTRRIVKFRSRLAGVLRAALNVRRVLKRENAFDQDDADAFQTIVNTVRTGSWNVRREETVLRCAVLN